MIKWPLVPYTRGNGIQTGSDEKLFPHFVGVDPYKLSLLASQSWNFVVANESIPEAWRLLKVGGYLCLQDGKPEAKGWDQVEDGEWKVYRKTLGEKYRFSCKEPKPIKTCAVIRYGAFGDVIQTSSIFPWLKEQGYHITFYCSDRAYPVAQHDPHVDRFVVQDTDQVPQHELGEFWGYLKSQYTKFINLSESIEGTLLALPGRANHEWSHEVRHKYLNHNYLEITHDIAGVPFPPRQKFYRTDQEKAWARKERSGNPVILWTLAGSSIHKTWPYLDQVIARLLVTFPSCRIYLVGDELCQLLESGWEGESRVIRKSGKWSIRQTLSFLPECDLIVGPETGVMNAAGFLPVPKIVTLSHSSEENLTKHWVNCVSLTPLNTACYPCHQLHYSSEFCPRGETGTSICQENISVDAMWSVINERLRKAA